MKTKNSFYPEMVFAVLFIIFCFGCGTDHSNNGFKSSNLDTVFSPNGVITGKKTGMEAIRVFKGIHYAKAPADNLRWMPPVPAEPFENVFNATNFGDNCDQGGGGPAPPVKAGEPANPYTAEYEINKSDPQSENCLCLNIWTPAKTKDDNLPVLVFINGGGLGGGSGSIPLYYGEGLARKGIIVITINYRLAIFGFFFHPALRINGKPAGNFGLLDQIEALKWVQKNISSFGGDPHRVTIAGQSAGAWCVSALVSSPMTKGLFHRAIAQSGGIFTPADSSLVMNPFLTTAHAEREGARFVRNYPCQDISELRKESPKNILKKSISYELMADGILLPKDIYTAFAENKQNDIPLLIGWNADDARGFGWQARTFATMAAKNQKSKVFVYFFTKVAPGTPEEINLGAYHSAEIAYVFNNLQRWNRPWTNGDYKLSDIASSYWANFVITGDPNGPILTVWPVFKINDQRCQELGEKVVSIPIPGKEEYDFFNKLFHK